MAKTGEVRRSDEQAAPEQRLLCAQDLHSGGRVLGQIGEGAGMRDEARAHHLSDKGRQVGGHLPALEICWQLPTTPSPLSPIRQF